MDSDQPYLPWAGRREQGADPVRNLQAKNREQGRAEWMEGETRLNIAVREGAERARHPAQGARDTEEVVQPAVPGPGAAEERDSFGVGPQHASRCEDAGTEKQYHAVTDSPLVEVAACELLTL